MTDGNVTIDIFGHGDPTVGIPEYRETIELTFWPDMDTQEERERVRGIFQRAFAELTDDKIGIKFGDECYLCLKLKINCLCPDDIK